MSKNNRYWEYKGYVTYFGENLAYIEVSTWATSPSKARNNILYRFKKENNLVPNMKLNLYGELKPLIATAWDKGVVVEPEERLPIQERLFDV